LASRPLQADLYFHFGLASELSGDSDRALDAYKQALGVQPQYRDAFERCAGLQFERREWDSLLAVIDRWIEANPTDSMGPLLRAEVVSYQSGSKPPEETP
jgi:tetratricopeptide (TPR) repeat protein